MKSPEPLATPKAPKAGPPTLLLVDDDPEMLSALQRAFRNEPYDVLATGDPFEALAWIKSGAVDVVIADEFMPAMLGTELLEAARRFAPESVHIILTGYPNTSVAGRAFQQQVDLVMTKPWEDSTLRASVRRLLEGRA